MKKFLLGLNLFALTSFPFPTGIFVGSGVAIDRDGKKHNYQSSVSLTQDSATIDYSWHGLDSALLLNLPPTSEEWFDLYHNDENVGVGYCRPNQCYYVATIKSIFYRESLYFLQDENNEVYIIKFGEKFGPGVKTSWQDELHLTKKLRR